ncbi:MAG: DUF5681 domain-containing protein [Caulobacterales bacterium]
MGYGRPPQHSRFQRGQSGNPRGRPRGQPNLVTDIMNELAEQIRIREGDRERSVSKQRAMVKALVAKSLKGEARAAALLINLLVKLGDQTGPLAETEVSVTAADQQVIDDFLKRAMAETGAKGGGNEQ